jgi:hypothetical protein
LKDFLQVNVKDNGSLTEGVILGHPDNIRKTKLTFKQEDLERNSKIEKVTQVIYNENMNVYATYDFIELAPEVFSVLRKLQ